MHIGCERDERLLAAKRFTYLRRIGDVIAVCAAGARSERGRAIEMRNTEGLQIRNALSGIMKRELCVQLKSVGGSERGSSGSCVSAFARHVLPSRRAVSGEDSSSSNVCRMRRDQDGYLSCQTPGMFTGAD